MRDHLIVWIQRPDLEILLASWRDQGMLWTVLPLLPLLLFMVVAVMGQDKIWTRLVGSTGEDRAYAVAVDPNSGSVYVTGWGVAVDSTSGAVYVTGQVAGTGPNVGGFDIVLLKYASNGTRLWTRISGTTGTDIGYGVAFDTSSGGVYVTGQVSGSLNGVAYTAGNGGDIILLKYTSSGTVVWTRIVGTNGTLDAGYGVAVDSSTGDVYVSGQAHGSLNGETYTGGGFGTIDIFLLKYSSSGTLLWTKMAGGSNSNDYGVGVAVDTSTGDVYATGVTGSSLHGVAK
eukprot:gene29409-35498_t